MTNDLTPDLAHAAAIEAAIGAALRAIKIPEAGYRDENERLLSRAEKEITLEVAKAIRALHTDSSRAALDEIRRQERVRCAGMFHDEQLEIWASEILGRLSMDDLITPKSYDEVVDAHKAVADELKCIAAAIMEDQTYG